MSARRLSYDDAERIRERHEAGESISSIARLLGVNPTTVSRIINSEAYMRPKQYDRKAE